MKFKYSEFQKAMDHFRYSLSLSDAAVIDVALREEDMDGGKLCDVLTLTVTTTTISKYSKYKAPVTATHIMEIFPESENRPIRLTKQESQDLSDDLPG